jgi:hypothetical protein
LVDDLVYETMTDCSTREFLFHVVPVKVVDIESEVVDAFTSLRKAQSADGILLPPPRATLDMTDDDELYNHVLRGVVLCMDCGKPRCVYSAQAFSKMKPHGEYTKEDEIDCRYAFISSVFFIALTS